MFNQLLGPITNTNKSSTVDCDPIIILSNSNTAEKNITYDGPIPPPSTQPKTVEIVSENTAL
jgi:phosphatidylethanolamine-binding protein (PEBP) family uncharacterized protein